MWGAGHCSMRSRLRSECSSRDCSTPTGGISPHGTIFCHVKLPSSPVFHVCQRPGRTPLRSEEHTSELQSLMRTSYAVCCLNKKSQTQATTIQANLSSSRREHYLPT